MRLCCGWANCAAQRRPSATNAIAGWSFVGRINASAGGKSRLAFANEPGVNGNCSCGTRDAIAALGIVVVVRISKPVARLRSNLDAPASGVECRSVSLLVRESVEDWAQMLIPVPRDTRTTAVTASSFARLCFTSAIKYSRGRSKEKTRKSPRPLALTASKELGKAVRGVNQCG